MSNTVHPITLPGSAEKKQESRDAQKVLRMLTHKLRPLGFERTKPSFFTRSGRLTIEFVHVHKYTFGPAFRVHLGIRVRNDEFPAAGLNGPSSDAMLDPATPERPYRFDFTSEVESQILCANRMAELVAKAGMEWFDSLRDPKVLVSSARSPLSPPAIAALERALRDPSAAITSPATHKVLNAA